MSKRPSAIERPRFLKLATFCEGALLAIAFGLGWVLSIDPLTGWAADVPSLAWSALGTLPLYAIFAAGYREPSGEMRLIKDFLVDRLGPSLSACHLYELLYLGLLAGVAEELFFRGILQQWFEREWGWFGGLLISNLIFALLHWVTPLYGLLAGVTGLYLGLSLDVTGERNVLVPTLIHGIYDFLAFIAVARSYRAKASAG